MSTANSRKRKIDDDHQPHELQPLVKKQRRVTNNLEISAVFNDDSDEQQYLNIYNTLIQTQLIKNTDTPSVISQLISEYSTGNVSECFYCHEIVYYLKGDTFENDIFKIKQGLVCKQCKEKQITCTYCDTNYNLFASELCAWCRKKPLCSNIDNCKNNNECRCSYRICNACCGKCAQCETKVCASCGIDCDYEHMRCDDPNCCIECTHCGEEICIECKHENMCNICQSIACTDDCLMSCDGCDASCCEDCIDSNGNCLQCKDAENDEMNEIEANDYY